jgi:broad specificity phosphatase PhoE
VPPVNVLLVRHGQSESNAGLSASNHVDVALTELGESQAEEVAREIDECPALVVVSRFARSRQSAAPLLARFPRVRCETWPIEEFTYLNVPLTANTTPEIRRPMIDHYWRLADPHYVDGPGAESFASFLARVQAFYRRLCKLNVSGTVVVVGHGQFFRAFMLCLAAGFDATRDGMLRFRAAETAQPMRNGEILRVTLSAESCEGSSADDGRS